MIQVVINGAQVLNPNQSNCQEPSLKFPMYSYLALQIS